jgi:hypothetical protein
MSKSRSANWFALIALLAFSIFDFSQAVAQEDSGTRSREIAQEVPTIFDVRKSLPMEPTEPTYHDFYINAGSEAGFKRGQYLPINRALPVHDPIQNKQQAILTVPVGKVLVIHVDRGLTVARLVQELNGAERPTLDYEAIMIGDRVDMKGITTVAPKPSGKKRTEMKTEMKTDSQSDSQGDKPVIEATDFARAADSAKPDPASAAAASATATIQQSVQTLSANPAADKAANSNPPPATIKSGATDAANPPQRVTQPVPPPTA